MNSGLQTFPHSTMCLVTQDYGVYAGFEESVAYVSDYVKMHGPFQGFIAFSQVGDKSNQNWIRRMLI